MGKYRRSSGFVPAEGSSRLLGLILPFKYWGTAVLATFLLFAVQNVVSCALDTTDTTVAWQGDCALGTNIIRDDDGDLGFRITCNEITYNLVTTEHVYQILQSRAKGTREPSVKGTLYENGRMEIKVTTTSDQTNSPTKETQL